MISFLKIQDEEENVRSKLTKCMVDMTRQASPWENISSDSPVIITEQSTCKEDGVIYDIIRAFTPVLVLSNDLDMLEIKGSIFMYKYPRCSIFQMRFWIETLVDFHIKQMTEDFKMKVKQKKTRSTALTVDRAHTSKNK